MSANPNTAFTGRPLLSQEASMTDRRRNARFSVHSAWEGQLRTLEDVVVESHTSDDVWVISRTPATAGERFMLHLANGGPPVLLGVRVAESRPILVEGMIRNRVHLVVIERRDGPEGTDARVLNDVHDQSKPTNGENPA
jgi:hypothetical protein